MNYGSSRTTDPSDAIDSTDDHFPKDEKDFTEIPRKTVTIAESTDAKPSTGAPKETEPLLPSQKTEQ